MSKKDSEKKISVTLKAHTFLMENRVEFFNKDRISRNSNELIADITVLNTDDLSEDNEKIKNDKYTVLIRKDGTSTCTCENFVYSAKIEEYRQFWGDKFIRARPECSHVLAVKFTPTYIDWILDPNHPNREELIEQSFLLSYVKSSRKKISPEFDLEKSENYRPKKRKVIFSELIRSRENDE